MALINIGKYTNVKDAIFELQSQKAAVATGTTAATNIAISGLQTKDTLLSVIGYDGDNATPASSVTDFTANASIPTDGNLQVSVDTSGYQLVVSYWSKPGWRPAA